MSSILRHNAENYKIAIRSDGYVLLTDLLEHMNKVKKWKLSEMHIKAEVQLNEKQRYALAEIDGKLMVRAQQGHSLKLVENEELLEAITNPFTYNEVVHGTYYDPMPKIMEGGLNKMKRNHIHFALGTPGANGVISGMRASC